MKKVWFTPLVICSLVFFTYHNGLAAGETPDTSDLDSIAEVGTEPEVEMPEFSNPAQAAHAANLADAVASAPNEATKDAGEDVEDAEDNLDKANAKLEKANADLLRADDEAANAIAEASVEAAGTALAAAIDNLAEKKDALDEAIAELAGVVAEDIKEMRDYEKMGWGQIAHELGVHPRAIGLRLGHINKNKKGKNYENGLVDEPAEYIEGDLPAIDFEIAEATKRNTQHGWAKGHGMVTSVDSGGKKGLGLSSRDLGVGSKGAKNSKENSSSSRSNSSNSSSNSGKSSSSKGSSASSSADNSRSDRSSSTGGPSSSDKSNNGQGADKDKADKSNNDKSNNSGGKSK